MIYNTRYMICVTRKEALCVDNRVVLTLPRRLDSTLKSYPIFARIHSDSTGQSSPHHDKQKEQCPPSVAGISYLIKGPGSPEQGSSGCLVNSQYKYQVDGLLQYDVSCITSPCLFVSYKAFLNYLPHIEYAVAQAQKREKEERETQTNLVPYVRILQ